MLKNKLLEIVCCWFLLINDISVQNNIKIKIWLYQLFSVKYKHWRLKIEDHYNCFILTMKWLYFLVLAYVLFTRLNMIFNTDLRTEDERLRQNTDFFFDCIIILSHADRCMLLLLLMWVGKSYCHACSQIFRLIVKIKVYTLKIPDTVYTII